MALPFPIRTEQTRSRRGASDGRGDSGYGASISLRDHRSDARPSRRSNSRDPPPPPSSFPKPYSTHSRRMSSRRDDRSNSSSRSVREQSFPPSPRGGERSSQADEHFIHRQHGVERQNRPHGSSGNDSYSYRDDQSTYERHIHTEPPPASDNLEGDRSNQSNGEAVYERSNPGGPPNSFRGGEYQDIPHYSHVDNNETSVPRPPEHQQGLSRREREFADAMGKGIGTMIRAMAYRPTKFHAVSMSVMPETMTWRMKTERVCAPCNDWIGADRFWSKYLCRIASRYKSN
jgi:hypothetical protein